MPRELLSLPLRYSKFKKRLIRRIPVGFATAIFLSSYHVVVFSPRGGSDDYYLKSIAVIGDGECCLLLSSTFSADCRFS